VATATRIRRRLRKTQHGPALFVGGWAVQQPWLFWVALIAGALLAGLVSRALFGPDVQELPVTGRESTSSVASVP
jgi:hypothetical protein